MTLVKTATGAYRLSGSPRALAIGSPEDRRTCIATAGDFRVGPVDNWARAVWVRLVWTRYVECFEIPVGAAGPVQP